uniref:Uncharacterized protein n=1 Tax=Sphaerodactylus townsendi TaxID=933632 RepID=A0ACB8FCY9_9SAUR
MVLNHLKLELHIQLYKALMFQVKFTSSSREKTSFPLNRCLMCRNGLLKLSTAWREIMSHEAYMQQSGHFFSPGNCLPDPHWKITLLVQNIIVGCRIDLKLIMNNFFISTLGHTSQMLKK